MKTNLTQIITAFCGFNRIFEKVMYKRLKSFIDMTYSPRASQYSFRENCSTQHALIDIVHEIQLNFDKKNYTHVE